MQWTQARGTRHVLMTFLIKWSIEFSNKVHWCYREIIMELLCFLIEILNFSTYRSHYFVCVKWNKYTKDLSRRHRFCMNQIIYKLISNSSSNQNEIIIIIIIIGIARIIAKRKRINNSNNAAKSERTYIASILYGVLHCSTYRL